MSRGFYSAPFKQGWIEIICGSMYCGKTEELIRRIRRAEIAKQKVQVFKPILDTRYSPEHVSSHAGTRYQAVLADHSGDIWRQVETDTTVVAIDEIQFFDEGIVQVVQALADSGRRVIASGLDMDFRGAPFGVMPQLLSMAESVEKLTAICVVCGAPATRSQRMINGKPAEWEDPVILVGASDVYEPRCRACHAVPVRPGVTQLPLMPLEASQP
ncbi:MAG: thymidine kinase [Bacteroidota bacterium]